MNEFFPAESRTKMSGKWLSAALVAFLLPGCGGGPKLVSVTGTVTMNGKPLEGANISFAPEPGNAVETAGTDITGPEGNYKLMYQGRSGVSPGKYKVAISKLEVKAGVELPENFKKDPMMAKMAGLTKETLPDQATGKAAEGSFAAEVKESGDNVFDFDVKAKTKAK
jgi:hypothetical protein